MLYGIGIQDVERVWSKVEPWIEGSAESTRGKYAADDIKSGILTGHAQLWVWDTPTAFGVIVTQIVKYPQNKCCVIKIGTGENAAEWAKPSLARLEEFAKVSGCDAMEIICRPGWERVLSGCGYDKTHVYLEKAL